jgi:hypothetical protein
MTRFEKWQDWMTNPKGLLFLVGVVLFVLAFGIFMWADPVPVPVRRYRIPGIHLGYRCRRAGLFSAGTPSQISAVR